MFKVYLVDDEKPIIDELLTIVDWKGLNCEVCGYSTDPLVAIEEINKIKPDVLISDINMSGLNGLELVAKVIKGRDDLGVILLTAYDLFDYVAEALKLRVLSYLVKPVDTDELSLVITQFQKARANALFYDFFKMLENCIVNEKTVKQVENKSLVKGFIKRGKRYAFAFIDDDQTDFQTVAEYKGEDYRFAILKIDENDKDTIESFGDASFWGGESFLRHAKAAYEQKLVTDSDDKDKKEIKVAIDKIVADIESNFDQKISLGYYALKYHYNLTYLSQQFKLHLGINFIDYLIKVKMEKAKEFMRDKSLNMAGIAYKVGYDDYSHFSKIFKKYEGISPADYRKNYC